MTNIPFMGLSKRFFTISSVVAAVILLASFVLGVELDVQFKGGSIITYSYEGDLDKEAFARAAQELTQTNLSIQESTDIATGRNTVVLTMPGTKSLTAEEMAAFTEGLQERFPQNNPHTLSINNVSATMGFEFLTKCLTAVAFASLLMVIYVAFRFRRIGGWAAGVMGVVALIHDIIIVFGVFVLLRIPLNGNFIAVVLTILGYSLNDTIVIYDRIRENKKLLGDKMSLSDLVDLSINQSFRRTLNTTITTVLAMVVVTVVALIYNVESIITFSGPMILGLVSGVYSSICIAGPLWVRWRNYRDVKA
ncbi:MAG: protein translocase subunit SecF [Oscillospiraceae bacterium]|jgi:preprotein translocase subunit SecF